MPGSSGIFGSGYRDKKVIISNRKTVIGFQFCCIGFKMDKKLIYSHSIVAGGFPEISYTTLETLDISFIILLDTLSKKS